MPSFKNNKQMRKRTSEHPAEQATAKQTTKQVTKQVAKQSLDQSLKLKTMAAERDQLRADNAIVTEHLHLRGEEIIRQARLIESLKTALVDEKGFSAALYSRLVEQAQGSIEQDVKIAELELEVDHWLDEDVRSLEIYYSAEADVVGLVAFIRSDPLTMAALDGSHEDIAVKETIHERLIAAQMEGELWYHKKMERSEID